MLLIEVCAQEFSAFKRSKLYTELSKCNALFLWIAFISSVRVVHSSLVATRHVLCIPPKSNFSFVSSRCHAWAEMIQCLKSLWFSITVYRCNLVIDPGGLCDCFLCGYCAAYAYQCLTCSSDEFLQLWCSFFFPAFLCHQPNSPLLFTWLWNLVNDAVGFNLRSVFIWYHFTFWRASSTEISELVINSFCLW